MIAVNGDSNLINAKKTSTSMKLFGTADKGYPAGKDGTATVPALIVDKSKPPRFDTDKFIIHNGNDAFLKCISQTQIFSKFIQEKTSSLFQEGLSQNTNGTLSPNLVSSALL